MGFFLFFRVIADHPDSTGLGTRLRLIATFLDYIDIGALQSAALWSSSLRLHCISTPDPLDTFLSFPYLNTWSADTTVVSPASPCQFFCTPLANFESLAVSGSRSSLCIYLLFCYLLRFLYWFYNFAPRWFPYARASSINDTSHPDLVSLSVLQDYQKKRWIACDTTVFGYSRLTEWRIHDRCFYWMLR